MQSFVSPMEIDVLRDGRICVPEKSRNLSDVQLLFLEHVRKEMPQRMMCDIRDFRFRARRLQRSSNLFVSPSIPIREQRFIGSRLRSEPLGPKLHFFFDAGQSFRVQRNVLRLSTLPDHSKRTTVKIDVSNVCLLNFS